MASEDVPRRVATCDLVSCRLHDGVGACRLAAGVASDELAAVLEPQGALGQPGCPLLRGLCAEVRRLFFGEANAPSREELLAHVQVALHEKLIGKARRPRVNTSYVFLAVRSWVTDQVRRVQKRFVCEACRRYVASERRCGRPDAPYGALPPDSVPTRLEPPCREFDSILRFAALPESGPVQLADDDAETLLEWVLDAMRQRDREAWALLQLHRLQGLSLREIQRETGIDRRRLATTLARSDALFLGILDEWT